MKNNFIHIFLTLGLLVLLTCLTDPFMYWMPEMAAMMVLLGVTVLMGIFAGLVMHENGGDEREVFHRMNAGRAAYLSGIAVLTLAVLVQGLTVHTIDPWISITLGTMVVVKLVTRFYFDTYN